MKMKVLHMGEGLVVTSDAQNYVQLQHPIVRTHNIQVMITTGAGYKQIGKIDEEGDFLFAEGNMKITEHMKYKQSGIEVFGAKASMYIWQDDKGWRQCGGGTVNMERLLHNACEGTPFEFAANMFIPTEQSSTTTVKISMTSTACTQERVALRSWLDTHADIVQVLKYCVVSNEELYKQLATSRKRREQDVSDSLNGIHGNVNEEVKLGNNLFLLQDTGIENADPTQLNAFLKKANLQERPEPMWMKNAVDIATTAFVSVAEQCVSDKHRQSGVDLPITIAEMKAYVEYNTSKRPTAKEMALRKQRYQKLITSYQNTTTLLMVAERPYAFDNSYKMQDDGVVVATEDTEKMDMWCGSLYLHWDMTQKKFSANMEVMQALQNERTKIIQQLNAHANIGLSAVDANLTESLVKVTQEINTLNGEQQQLRDIQTKQRRDCEDGAMATVIQFEVAKKFPRKLFEIMKPYCGNTFIPVSDAYPNGLAATVNQAYLHEQATQTIDKIAEIQRVVELSLQLVSDALKWQGETVDGTNITYETCLGLASAPSMDANSDTIDGAPAIVSREKCTSYGDLIVNLFKGHKLGGHCFAAQAKTSNVRKLANGGTVSQMEISANRILESTTSNVRIGEEEYVPVLAAKTINTSINGVFTTLHDVSHEKVRLVVGRQVLNEITRTLGHELIPGNATNIDAGSGFYNVFAHIGNNRCFGGEKSVGNKTSTLNASETLEAMHNSCMATSFCNSTIAWDACPTSKVTTTAVISMPLHEEEEHRLDQLVHELTTIHAMTEEQLSFMMTKMGYVVNAGFENGLFVGTDFTGTRLDSDKRVALTLTLQTTKFAATLPEYCDPHTSVGTVILRKLAVVLPTIEFRIKKIETCSYVLQAFVDVGQILPEK